MKKIIKIIATIIIMALILLLLLDVIIVVKSKTNPDKVPGILGYKPFIVLSGSMMSKIEVGDLVFVKETDATTLKENDIIAFRDDEDLVTTHRIIKVIKENGEISFETKGDSNNVKDEKRVYPKDIEGIYIFKIEKLGKFILFLQEPLGFSIMMLAILIIGAIMFMMDNRKNAKEEKILDQEYLKEFEEFKRKKAEEKRNS